MSDIIDFDKKKKERLLKVKGKVKPQTGQDGPGGIDRLYQEGKTRKERIKQSLDTIKQAVQKLEKEKALLAFGLKKSQEEAKPTLEVLKGLLEDKKRVNNAKLLGTYMNAAEKVKQLADKIKLSTEDTKKYWVNAQKMAIEISPTDVDPVELIDTAVKLFDKYTKSLKR